MATANALPTAAQPAAASCNPTRSGEQGLWLHTVSAKRPEPGSACAVVAAPQAEHPSIAVYAFLEGPASHGLDLTSAIAARIGLASRRRVAHHGRRWG